MIVQLLIAVVVSLSLGGTPAAPTSADDCCSCCPGCAPGCDCPLCECCGG